MIHRLVPTFILEKLAAGQTRGSFSAVGLFVDISGFSTLTDGLMAHGQHGAEVLARVIGDVMAPLINAVFEQGGFVATQAGDAFTALFPLAAMPDAPRRALAAAWQIQQLSAARAIHLTPYGEFSISVKAGLALGEAAWGIVVGPIMAGPGERRATYYFQGKAIDRCAEAEHDARPGEIVLDATLYAAVGGLIVAEAERDFYLLKRIAFEPAGLLPLNPPEVDLAVASHFFAHDLWVGERAGEFRQVVALFVSLPNLRTESQLGQFLQTVFGLQERYGGLLAQLDFGDKGANLILVWGAPVAHENDVERALGFILDLQSQTAIPINGGLTYRIAHVGFIGSEMAEQYAAYSRGVNLAARFMTHAPRGEIWLDAPAAARAQLHFTVEPIGPWAFKGFAEPQMVYRLLERQERAPLTYLGRWVGRASELSALEQFVAPIFSGACAGAMVVWGEPGMGKSRLVYEFLRGLGEHRPSHLICLAQTDEIMRQSLNPFRYWLHAYLGLMAAATEARNKRAFNRKIDDLIAANAPGRLADELDRTRSFLGALVGLRWSDSLYEEVDTPARYENTLIALVTLLQAESRRQPLVLVVEDAHWLDTQSQELLPRLLRAITAESGAAYPMAVLATARYEGAGLPLADFARTELALAPLARPAIRAQAEALLGAPPSGGLLDVVEQRAEGNPFFAEQIIRYLQSEGELELKDGEWRLLAAAAPPLPGDVNALLVARLDRLTQDVRAVVQTAAVLGREFEVRLLSHMLRDEAGLADKLAQAEAQGIWSALSELRHIFRHALLRDAAYNMQVHARRQALHALATSALEGLDAVELKPRYAELAYHSEQAGLDDKARHYLRLAGSAAGEAYQNALALEYFTRALALTPPEALGERYDLLSAREAIYALQASQPERQQDLAALGAVAGQLGDARKRVTVAVRRADCSIAAGNYGEAAQIADEAVTAALAAPGTSAAPARELGASAYFSAADAWRKQADYAAALGRAEAGLALAREFNQRPSEASLLNLLGLIELEQKNLDRAADYFQASLAIYQALGDRRGQAKPLNNLGNLAGFKGDYPAAQRCFNQSLVIAREIGHRAGESLVLNNLGWIAGLLGDIPEAQAYAELNLRLAREIGDRLSETYGLINLSAYAGELGDFQAAVDGAQHARALAQAARDRSAEAWALTNLGHGLAGQADWAGAAAAYQAALDLRTELAQPALATEPRAGLARVALARGARAAAMAHVDVMMGYLQSGGTLDGADDPLRVYLSAYQVLRATADGRASAVLATAFALLQTRAGVIADEDARRRYLQNVASHREIMTAWAQDQAHVPD